MIVMSVKLGLKETGDGEVVEAIAATARDTLTGKVLTGSFSGSRETILNLLKLLESNSEVKIKYE